MLVISVYFFGDDRQFDILDLLSLPLGPHLAGLSDPCSPWKSLAVNPLLNRTLWFSGLTSTGQQFWIWFVVASDDFQHGKIDVSCKRTQLLSLCLLFNKCQLSNLPHRAQLNKRTRSDERSICLRQWPEKRLFRDSMQAQPLSLVSLCFPASTSVAAQIAAVCASLPSTFSIFCSWICLIPLWACWCCLLGLLWQ